MNVLGLKLGKRTQAIQPYQFGHLEQKETWLWLHGLPPLRPTKDVYARMMELPIKKRERLYYLPPGPGRAKERSRTFTGISKAMAKQWEIPRHQFLWPVGKLVKERAKYPIQVK